MTITYTSAADATQSQLAPESKSSDLFDYSSAQAFFSAQTAVGGALYERGIVKIVNWDDKIKKIFTKLLAITQLFVIISLYNRNIRKNLLLINLTLKRVSSGVQDLFDAGITSDFIENAIKKRDAESEIKLSRFAWNKFHQILENDVL